MKIVHISIFPEKGKKHSETGGVSSYTKNLITNIPYNLDDEVYIICNKINSLFESYEEEGIKVVRCFDKDYRFLTQILKEICKIDPDVIHIQQELALYGNIFTSYLLQWLVLFLRKYKTIITLHGVVSLKSISKEFVRGNNSNLPVFLVKLAFLIVFMPLCIFAKKIIVHEKIFKDILIKEYLINENKVEVIPHGIEDLKSIEIKEARSYLNLPNNKKIVLFMGYLTGYKGLDLLIEGFREFIKTEPESLLIVGAGVHPKLKNDEDYKKEYSRIKNKAEKELGSNHIWVGFINESEIVYYYSAADVSIYPYTCHISSSGPMAIAVAYEKPFLASDVFSNFIDNKEILFNRNPESLSNCLKYFFENKISFSDFALDLKKSRSYYEISKKTYSIYSKILS